MSAEKAVTEKKTLMGGVAVLMPATLFTKIVGLFYKIPLIAIVGVEGMAYFLAAYHVYSMLFVLSATGLPTALSLQVARAVAVGKGAFTRRIFGVALCLFLSLGLGGTVFLIGFAPALAARLAMRDAAAAIVAIAPALFLSAFIGAAKGYFQGHQRMLPTAVCEVIEAGGKLGFGLCFALMAKAKGLAVPYVAAAAIFGITVGLALAALVLGVWLLLARFPAIGAQGTPPRRRAVLGELCRVALPVTVSASVMSLVSLIDTALISSRLQAAGFSPAVANAMYSSYGNLAVPLYNLIPALLSPITLALMPLLGAASSRGERESAEGTLRAALRLCALVAIPSALGLSLFAEPVLRLIYAGQSDAIAVAAPALSLLAPAILPAALLGLTGAALQATGHTVIPVVAMGCGALAKLISQAILLPLPGIYIKAAPISTLLCNLIVLLIECVALGRLAGLHFLRPEELFRPLFAAICAIGLGGGVYFTLHAHRGEALWQMPLVLLLVIPLFFLLALLFGAVRREELLALPAGEKVCALLDKYKLLRK